MTPILIDKRQLLYLKTMLNQQTHHWTKQMLLCLRENNIGWAAQMVKKLEEYELETSWEKITKMEKKSHKSNRKKE